MKQRDATKLLLRVSLRMDSHHSFIVPLVPAPGELMINKYVEIVPFYDRWITSGYYDFESLARALHALLDGRRTLLDMGVGTGLLTEQLLLLGDYQITGVDFRQRCCESLAND